MKVVIFLTRQFLCSIIVALITCIALLVTAHADVITIDPSTYSSGTDIGNPYTGVTLSTARGYVDFVDFDPTPTLVETIHLTGPVIGSAFTYGPYIASSNYSNWASDPYYGRFEVLMVHFSIPVDSITMSFHPDDIDTGILGVFDQQDNLLSHQYLRTRNSFTLSYDMQSTPIAYALAAFGDPGYLGAITFNTSAVPEPCTIFLVSTGIVGFGLLRKRFKN
jgi:hypothetical protein